MLKQEAYNCMTSVSIAKLYLHPSRTNSFMNSSGGTWTIYQGTSNMYPLWGRSGQSKKVILLLGQLSYKVSFRYFGYDEIVTWERMKQNNNEAVNEVLWRQKTHQGEVLLMETQPSPQGGFSGFQLPIWSTHPEKSKN